MSPTTLQEIKILEQKFITLNRIYSELILTSVSTTSQITLLNQVKEVSRQLVELRK